MSFEFDPEQRYMMPAHFGPRPAAPSARYHDVTKMVISYRTDRDKLAAYVPAPFEVTEDAIVSVVYSCGKQIDWLAGHGYNLIGVNASVVFNGKVDHLQGAYTLVMWENLTDPILTGRELQGIPKIYADIPDHTVCEGTWRVAASHFSHRILQMTITDLTPCTDEQIANSQKAMAGKDNWMGWKYIPNPNGEGAALSTPTLFPSSRATTDLQVGTGTIAWEQLTWEQNPTQYHIVNALHDLPILEYCSASVAKGSTNLVVAGKPVRELQ